MTPPAWEMTEAAPPAIPIRNPTHLAGGSETRDPTLTVMEFIKLAVVSRQGKATRFYTLLDDDRQISEEAEGVAEIFHLADKQGVAAKNLPQGDKKLLDVASHAIALLTEWEIYRHLDLQKIYESMVRPAFIFDGRNILDHRRCFDIGFNVYPVGKTPLTHF